MPFDLQRKKGAKMQKANVSHGKEKGEKVRATVRSAFKVVV
jgi:hypothetical protein